MKSYRVLKEFQTAVHRFRPGTDEQPNVVQTIDLSGQVPVDEWLRLGVIEEMPEEKAAAAPPSPPPASAPHHPAVPRPQAKPPQPPVDEKKE